MKITIKKEDFLGYAFSSDYIKWIQDKHKCIQFLNNDEIIIESDSAEECIKALIFLGYAWGQQDNGR